jgi:hypothetical protein
MEHVYAELSRTGLADRLDEAARRRRGRRAQVASRLSRRAEEAARRAQLAVDRSL